MARGLAPRAFQFLGLGRQATLLACCAFLSLLGATGGEVPDDLHAGARQPARPKLHLVTFSDIFDPRLLLPLTSAYSNGLRPLVLGFGSAITWGPGMGSAWNTYRHFVLTETELDDLVLFFDAYDVIFQAGETELVDMYLEIEARTGREVVYNADPYCSSPRKADYPDFSATPWRYLNCGVYIGRSRALRKLFKEDLPKNIIDKDGKPKRLQNWHTDFFLDNQDVAMVDTQCQVSQLIFALPGLTNSTTHMPENLPKGALDLVLESGKVRNTLTNTTPLILHFAGPGHWPDWKDENRVGTCVAYEVLRSAHPEILLEMEKRSVEWGSGRYFGPVPWKPVCTVYVSFFDYCGYRLQHLGDWIAITYYHSNWPLVLLVGASFMSVACGRTRLRSALSAVFACCSLRSTCRGDLGYDVKDV